MIRRIRRTIRSTAPDFPTWAAQFVEDGRRAEVLMVARTPAGLLWLHHKGAWRLPTGTVERGERALACLRREVEEEFGAPLPLVALLGVLQIGVDAPRVRGSFTSYLFLLDAGDHVPRPGSEEGIAAWCLATAQELRLVAAQLRALPPGTDAFGRDWSLWGAFRGIEHEVVADVLQDRMETGDLINQHLH